MKQLLLLLLDAVDGGALPQAPQRTDPPSRLSPEDQELVRHLELLENLAEASDLELLEDLALEQ